MKIYDYTNYINWPSATFKVVETTHAGNDPSKIPRGVMLLFMLLLFFFLLLF